MENLEKKSLVAYLTVVFVIGIFFVFNNTPLTGLDERFHFFRALQISEGQFLAHQVGGKENSWGGDLDGKMMEYVRLYIDNQDHRLPTSKKTASEYAETIDAMKGVPTWSLPFPSSASFSPLMYLPSALGIKLAGVVGFGVEGKLFAGRIFNLFCYIAMLAWLYRAMPFLKVVSVLVFTFPTMINLASSYSADPVTNLTTALFIAYCLRGAYADGKFKIQAIAIGLLVGFMKITNVLFLPVVLLIRKDRFKSNKNWLLFCASVIALGVLTAVVWNHDFKFVPSLYWGTGGSVGSAINYLMHQPYQGVLTILSNAYSQFVGQVIMMFAVFGGGPAPFNWIFSGYYVSLFFVIAVLMICYESNQATFKKSKANISAFFLLAVASYISIFFAFFIGYSPVSSSLIIGVQGRYFFLSMMALCIGSFLAINSLDSMKFKRNFTIVPPLLLAFYSCLLITISFKSLHNYAQIYTK